MNGRETVPKESPPLPDGSISVESAPLPERVPGAPLLGNTFQFLSDTSGLIAQSYKRFGPVFRLRALWLKYTVLGGFEARDFLNSGEAEKHLSRRKIFDAVGEQLGNADFVLGQSGEKHLRFRQILSLVYSREVASAFVPDFIAAVQQEIKSWTTGESRVVMPDIKFLSFELYCRVMCGGSLRQHYRDCLMVTEYNMNIGGRVWPFFLYKAPWYQAARRRVLKLIWDMVRERRAKPPPGDDRPATLLDTLLRVTDRAGQRLSDDEAVCYSMYGFAGSASYMSRLIGFMLYEILKHPELMKTLVAEADAAFARGLKDASDVRQMTHLRAVYHETLRFHPVSQGMPYHADEDFVFAGRKIRKGDTAVISQVPMSFSECPFHRPQEFDHTRCLDPRNEHKTTAFHPFGIGHRTCTAMGLVELMSLTMVATLLHALEFEMSPAGYRLKLTVKPLPAPDDNFRIRLRGRRAPGVRGPAPHYAEEYIVAAFPGADDPDVQRALGAAEIKIFEPGETIIAEGAPADAFYVIASGTADVSKRMAESEVPVARLERGQYFGEIGLMQNVARTASVRAASGSPVTIMKLTRDAFLELVGTADLESGEIGRLMRKRISTNQLIEAVHRLSAQDLVRLLPEFQVQTIAPGTTIIREGEAADAFYILDAGEVTITSRKDGAEQVVGVLGPGSYFGELGLLSGQPRAATVTASGATDAVVLRTDKSGFEELISGVADAHPDLAAALMERLKGIE
ncbi:MAG TPA: cytochrome P450 [Chthoniobacterales bacterium]|nr:cytochrome P450 [Chthoniobacterales bacterium]